MENKKEIIQQLSDRFRACINNMKTGDSICDYPIDHIKILAYYNDDISFKNDKLAIDVEKYLEWMDVHGYSFQTDKEMER